MSPMASTHFNPHSVGSHAQSAPSRWQPCRNMTQQISILIPRMNHTGPHLETTGYTFRLIQKGKHSHFVFPSLFYNSHVTEPLIVLYLPPCTPVCHLTPFPLLSDQTIIPFVFRKWLVHLYKGLGCTHLYIN